VARAGQCQRSRQSRYAASGDDEPHRPKLSGGRCRPQADGGSNARSHPKPPRSRPGARAAAWADGRLTERHVAEPWRPLLVEAGVRRDVLGAESDSGGPQPTAGQGRQEISHQPTARTVLICAARCCTRPRSPPL
jgi:hypothetical protein